MSRHVHLPRLFTPKVTLDGALPLRFGIGLVFLWFGAPKLVPGLSPAEALIRQSVPCFDPAWFIPTLGAAECLIGLCFWIPRWTPVGLLLLAGHMFGACLPLLTLPEVAWKAFPVATLEGQYMLKNVVLVAGALVVAGSGREHAPSRARSQGPVSALSGCSTPTGPL